MLTRTKTPFPEAAKKGVDFENMVYDLLRAKKDLEKIGGSATFKKILRACEGGAFQSKVKFFLTIDGEEYCMYGKLDVDLVKDKDLIIDLKTTAKWNRWSEDKYLKSMQHHMYCFGKKCPNFEYHIAVWDGDSTKIAQYHVLSYEAMSWAEEEKYLIEKVRDVRDFLATMPELDEAWRNTYSMY